MGMHQGSVLSPILFAVMVYVATEFAREGTLTELLYADDLVLISVTVDGVRNKFLNWKEAFESYGLKVNIEKTNAMVSGGLTKDDMSRSKVDHFGVCSLRVLADSVLCVQCGKWIHIRCAEVERVIPKFSRNFAFRKCQGNIGEAVEQEEKSCDEVGTVSEFTYLGDRESASGGYVAAVAARTICGWVKFMECG